MKGKNISWTPLRSCETGCRVQIQQNAFCGAASGNTEPFGFVEQIFIGLSGYEPRNGYRDLTLCSCYEQCGSKNPRKSICFLSTLRTKTDLESLFDQYHPNFNPYHAG